MRRATWFIFAGVIAAVFAAYVSAPIGSTLRVCLHVGLSQLCHGVSAGKIGYLLIMSCGLLAWLGVRHASLTTIGLKPRGRSMMVLWCVLGVGFAASLLSYVLYLRAIGLPSDAPTLHWRGGLNSFNSLTHIHTSKVAIALALEAAGQEHLLTKFDTGAPFRAFVPAWLAATIGACFVTSIALTFVVLPRIVARYPSQQRVGVALALCLALVSLTKGVLDGGMLAYDVVVAACMLAVLSRAMTVEDAALVARRLVVPLSLLVGAWVCIMGVWAMPSAMMQLWWAGYRLAVFVAILALTALYAPQAGPARLGAARGPLVLGGLAVLVACACAVVQVRTKLLPLLTHSRTLAAIHSDDAPQPEVREVPASQTLAQAAASFGDNAVRARRVSFPETAGKSAARGTGFYAHLWILAPGASVQRVLTKLAATGLVRSVQPASATRESQSYFVQVAFPGPYAPSLVPEADGMNALAENERFVALHALDSALRKQAIDNYVLVPYVMFRDEEGTK